MRFTLIYCNILLSYTFYNIYSQNNLQIRVKLSLFEPWGLMTRISNCQYTNKKYFQVIFYAIVIWGLIVLRVCYGPLPIFLCKIVGFLKGFAISFANITSVMYIFTRFMFVCIWKRMRQMDDNLIVRIATIQAVVMSLLFITTWLQLQDQRFRSAVRLLFLVCKLA